MTIDLSASSNQATDGTMSVTWTGDIIEIAIGGSGNDTITGSSGNNDLNGMAGNDVLYGGDGDDTLRGSGYVDADSLDGGAGNDAYAFYGVWGNDVITGDASGTDLLDLQFGSGNYTVNLTSGAGNEVTDGVSTVNWSSDFIENANGGTGNDSLTGNANANFLQGFAGNDTLNGLGGNDTLVGSTGDDTYVFSGTWGIDSIATETSGTDTVDLSGVTANLTINLTANTSTGVHEITDGTNTVDFTATSIENAIGGSGNDSMTGSSAANILTGKQGNDTLQGGAGNDVYQFAKGDGQDTVIENDTTAGNSDKLLFDSSVTQSNIAIFKTAGGDLQIGYTDSAGDLITVQGFGTAAGDVERFELSNGHYMSDADMNQVIADMAAYASTNSISITSISDVENNAGLMAIVNGGWHN